MSEPAIVARGDAVALTRELVRIDSRNPHLVPGSAGEAPAARALAAILEAWGFRVGIVEAAAGRPNVIARIGTPSRVPDATARLMFNGHLDTVATEGMAHAPFGEVRGTRLYGRGATDMKGGIAAMCAAAARAAEAGIAGEVVVAAVADEEWASIGTRAVIESGIRADAAIVTEPTRLAIAPAHRGFAWLELLVHGRAAHGSRYDIGIDAIRLAALVIAELDTHERETLVHRRHPLLGHASLHASLVEGGIGMSTYPDRCVVRLERRTLPGETGEDAIRELEEAITRVRARRPELRAEARLELAQPPSDVALEAPIVQALSASAAAAGLPPSIEGLSCWTDAALLNDAGIPAICFGPGDIALAHSAEEWVELPDVERAADTLTRLARTWCAV